MRHHSAVPADSDQDAADVITEHRWRPQGRQGAGCGAHSIFMIPSSTPGPFLCTVAASLLYAALPPLEWHTRDVAQVGHIKAHPSGLSQSAMETRCSLLTWQLCCAGRAADSQADMAAGRLQGLLQGLWHSGVWHAASTRGEHSGPAATAARWLFHIPSGVMQMPTVHLRGPSVLEIRCRAASC